MVSQEEKLVSEGEDDRIWTLLVENHRQIGFGPKPGNVLVTREYVDAFGVSEAWFDGIMRRIPGAKRWTSTRGVKGWIGAGEWKSRRPGDG